jgi:uroporphyrin-III C-methyltransferase/precorrin-2 dehydrogenase/sirohydrochlorin ferrochelatase
MRALAVFLSLAERPCLVVGAGAVARRKAARLLEAGAEDLHVVAPDWRAEFAEWEASGQLQLYRRAFAEGDLDGAGLVVAATASPATNRQVATAARQRLLPCDVAEPAAAGDMVLPATVDRDPLRIAVGAGGAAPALARRIRQELEVLLPPGLGPAARRLGEWRERAREVLPEAKRRVLWDRLAGQAWAEPGSLTDARIKAEIARLQQEEGEAQSCRVVVLGVGTGEVDRLTLGAWRKLRETEEAWCEPAIPDAVRALLPRQAPVRALPRLQGHGEVPPLPQAGVVRLRCGWVSEADPEVQWLREAGAEVDVPVGAAR